MLASNIVYWQWLKLDSIINSLCHSIDTAHPLPLSMHTCYLYLATSVLALYGLSQYLWENILQDNSRPVTLFSRQEILQKMWDLFVSYRDLLSLLWNATEDYPYWFKRQSKDKRKKTITKTSDVLTNKWVCTQKKIFLQRK